MNTVAIFASTSHWWECLMMEYQWDVILFLWINTTWCLCAFVCTRALSKLPECAVSPKSSREWTPGDKRDPRPLFVPVHNRMMHFLVHLNNRKLSGAPDVGCLAWERVFKRTWYIQAQQCQCSSQEKRQIFLSQFLWTPSLGHEDEFLALGVYD